MSSLTFARSVAPAVRSRRVRRGALAAALGATLITTEVRADEAPCNDTRLSVDGPLEPAWAAALAESCPRLPRGAEGDPSAAVSVKQLGPSVVVEVHLADGRSAIRIVPTPDKLPATLEAVLSLPPLPPPRPRTEATAPIAPAPPPPAAPPSVPSNDPKAAAKDPAGLDAGLLFGGRVAGAEPYLSLVPSLFGQVRIRGFVLGISTRWEVFQGSATSRNPEMETLAAGLVFGRRVGSGAFTFDLGISPRVTIIFQETGRRQNKVDKSTTDLRIGTFARGLFGKGNLKFVTELDFELSPADLRNDRQLDERLPLLPSWSAGLSFGAAWSDP